MVIPLTLPKILAACCVALAVAAAVSPTAAATTAAVDYREFRMPRAFGAGLTDGLLPGRNGLRIARPAGTVEHTEPGLGTTRRYEYATWTSPEHRPGFAATQLVASWNAQTPPGTWLQVEMRPRAGERWYSLGRWASGDGDIQRTSVPGQSGAAGMVDVDTFIAAQGLTGYRLRVTLYRLAGTDASPTLTMVGAMTSAVPDRFTVPASAPGPARGIELPVPRYSQNTHVGQYPQYGGGGEAWCSPTSTEMVVEYWGRGPSQADLAWVDPAYADPSVDHAARHTYDHAYDGTGNWPFNTAYAATFGLSAHVTRLRSMAELESHIAAGVPVITSQSFRADELDGAGYGTAGHLMVVVGFTPEGDVIANDPASPDNAAVRRVYDRAQFETIWLRTKRHTASGAVAGAPGGIAYIIRPARR
ncbi:C39 family peptidase [Actinokineospora iranica]|nr:C39 family peptidase [Actinokineospora iranica]